MRPAVRAANTQATLYIRVFHVDRRPRVSQCDLERLSFMRPPRERTHAHSWHGDWRRRLAARPRSSGQCIARAPFAGSAACAQGGAPGRSTFKASMPLPPPSPPEAHRPSLRLRQSPRLAATQAPQRLQRAEPPPDEAAAAGAVAVLQFGARASAAAVAAAAAAGLVQRCTCAWFAPVPQDTARTARLLLARRGGTRCRLRRASST